MKKTELKLQIYGSPILKKRCRRVSRISPEILQVLDKMVYLMRKYKGVGLAANQVGLEEALVVIETPQRVYKMINPKITKRRGKLVFEEGCLSFPGLTLSIKRAREVWVSYVDERAREVDLKAEGILAVILQHEIDHLNGILFIERISPLRKLRIKPILKEIKNRSTQ